MQPAAKLEDVGSMPQHIAIIMDGNGRWARARGLPRVAGHREGAEALRRVISAAVSMQIRYITVYGFSSENWKRPVSEVDDLMGLLRHSLKSNVKQLHERDIRLRVIGDRDRLAPDIVRLIDESEALTRHNRGVNLTIALSYGGRQEIVSAARKLADKAAAGQLNPEAIDEELFGDHLLTAELPDPDLLIRTSGEQRISNFLLWQSAYSEFIFTDRLWPDFDEEDMAVAIREYQKRDRRYGATASSR